MSRGPSVPLLAVVALAATAGVAGADGSYGGSVQFASGDYIFSERTTSWYVVNGVELSGDRLYVSASLPLVVQNTPWVTYGPVPIPSGGTGSGQVGVQIGQHAGRGPGQRTGSLVVTVPTTTVERHGGIGDPVLRGGVVLVSTPATRIRVGAAVKAPLARYEDGFGTGEWDVGAGVSLQREDGIHRTFGGVEFWRIGDLADLVLEDATMFQAGYERMFDGRRWSARASIQGWTAVLEATDPPIDVGIGVSRHLSGSGRRIGVSASIGLTQTAPDVSLALEWQLPF